MTKKNTLKSSLTPKQIKALPIIASIGNREQAAKMAGISKTCLYEWLKNPSFKKELENIQNEIFTDSFGFLKAASLKAASALIHLAGRSDAPAVQRAAANDVLNQVIKYKEVMEMERRMSEIEQKLALRDE